MLSRQLSDKRTTWFEIVADPSLIDKQVEAFQSGKGPSPILLAAELLEHLSPTNKASRNPVQRDNHLFSLAGKIVRSAALDIGEVQSTIPEHHQRRLLETAAGNGSSDESKLQKLNYHRWILRSFLVGHPHGEGDTVQVPLVVAEVDEELEDLSRDGIAFSMTENVPMMSDNGSEDQPPSADLLNAEKDSLQYIEQWITTWKPSKMAPKPRTATHMLGCPMLFTQTCVDAIELHLVRGRIDAAKALVQYARDNEVHENCKSFCEANKLHIDGLTMACGVSISIDTSDVLASCEAARKEKRGKDLCLMLLRESKLPWAYRVSLETDGGLSDGDTVRIKCCNSITRPNSASYSFLGRNISYLIEMCVLAGDNVPKERLKDLVSTVCRHSEAPVVSGPEWLVGEFLPTEQAETPKKKRQRTDDPLPSIQSVITACREGSADSQTWHDNFVLHGEKLLKQHQIEEALELFQAADSLIHTYQAASGILACTSDPKLVIASLDTFIEEMGIPSLNAVLELLGVLISNRCWDELSACGISIASALETKPTPPDDDEKKERDTALRAVAVAASALAGYVAVKSTDSHEIREQWFDTLIEVLLNDDMPFQDMLSRIYDCWLLHVLVASFAKTLRRFRIISRSKRIEVAAHRYLPILGSDGEAMVLPKKSRFLTESNYGAVDAVFERILTRLSLLDPDRLGGEWWLGLADACLERGEYARASALYVRSGAAASSAYTAPHLPSSPILDPLAVTRLPTCLAKSGLSWGVTAALASCQLRSAGPNHTERIRAVHEVIGANKIELDPSWLQCFWDVGVLEALADHTSDRSMVLRTIARPALNLHNSTTARLLVAEQGARSVLRRLYLLLCTL